MFQSEDSEIDVDDDDEEGEEEDDESKDLEDESLDDSLSKSNRPSRGGVRPPLLEESDDDFWMNTWSVCCFVFIYSFDMNTNIFTDFFIFFVFQLRFINFVSIHLYS